MRNFKPDKPQSHGTPHSAVFVLRKKMLLAFVTTLAVVIGALTLPSAFADNTPLPLTLKLSGPQHASVSSPVDIDIQLINSGLQAPDSRLRLFIHDGQDKELNLQNVQISLQENGLWVPVPFEVMDGGVLFALSGNSKTNADIHARGGFKIDKKSTQNWHLRVTFNLPGRYVLVASVSPNNGATQLTQPQNITLEVL